MVLRPREAGHVADDPRSLTGNGTARQQTLVVTAHVNEPLPWRCKPIAGRHHSSDGKSSSHTSWAREQIGESQHVQSLTSIMNTLVPLLYPLCENSGNKEFSAWNFGSIAGGWESDDRCSFRTHHYFHLTSDGSQSSNHKRRFSEPTLFS